LGLQVQTKIHVNVVRRQVRVRRRLLRVAAAAPDGVQSAKVAGLRYVSDGAPGIRRLRCGQGFVYVNGRGHRVRNAEVLARIRALVIPPAWSDVWICTTPHGHLQAVGRDAKGRKQYRYHARWRLVRDETKFSRLAAFGHLLTAIRRRTDADLAKPGLDRAKVLATIVHLLDVTHIRVGNEEYARNGAFGLTTMRDQHAKINGSRIHFASPRPTSTIICVKSRGRISRRRIFAPGPGRCSPPAVCKSCRGRARRRRPNAIS
jgi:DNA topoisomerase-1